MSANVPPFVPVGGEIYAVVEWSEDAESATSTADAEVGGLTRARRNEAPPRLALRRLSRDEQEVLSRLVREAELEARAFILSED